MKPVTGKSDSLEKGLLILKQLRARCGDGNFDILVLGGESVIPGLADEGFTGHQKVSMPPADSN